MAAQLRAAQSTAPAAAAAAAGKSGGHERFIAFSLSPRAQHDVGVRVKQPQRFETPELVTIVLATMPPSGSSSLDFDGRWMQRVLVKFGLLCGKTKVLKFQHVPYL